MSAKFLLSSTGQATPQITTLAERIWEASFGAGTDMFGRGSPLQLRLGTDLAELSVDAKASLAAPTYEERNSMIQCGAALFHLKLALQRVGHLGQLQLFPDLDQLSIVARISCEFKPEAHGANSVTTEGRSESQRESAPAGEALVSDRILAKLTAAGASRKAWLDFSQSEPSRKRLCEIGASEERPPRNGSGHDDGFTSQRTPTGARSIGALRSALVHLRVPQIASLLLGSPARTPDSPKNKESNGVEKPEDMVALAVLKTKTDDKYGWLAAGEVIARVRSEAQTLNVSSHVFGEAFRETQTRQELRNIIGRKGFVQAIIGFGSKSASCTANLTTSLPEPSVAFARKPDIPARMS
jgi:hypothetical protein